ncbi:MAG: hypothetical protein CL992_00675, partial [Euryarchaeota archaeon]|nr:hypothetical protein [Euryarchaeota archaeon]
MTAVLKVWIEEGCITCDACQETCPEVFSVTDESCFIKAEVREDGGFNENLESQSHLKSEIGTNLAFDIIDAAEGCPVDVIKFAHVDAESGATDSEEDGSIADQAVETEPDSAAPDDAATATTVAEADISIDGDRSLLILFGSQSGNSEGVCVKVGKMASKYGLEPTIKSMDEIQISEIPGHKRVMIVCSTWGEGDMPDNAEELWAAANGTSAPDLTGTHFSVLALGDTDYEYFCQSGKDWDEWFEKQGALRLVPRVDCDVDYDALAESWMLEVLPHLAAVDGNGTFQADAVETFKLKAAGGQTPTGEVVGAVGDLQGFTIPILELESVSATLILHRYDP